VIPEIDYLNQVSKAMKAISRLHPDVKKAGKKEVRASGEKGKAAALSLYDNDDDDFVSPPPPKTRSKSRKQEEEICSRTSSDDFVTQQGKRPPSGRLVLSNKRATKVSKKLRVPVAKLVPYTFPLLSKVRDLKNLILSKDFLQEFGK
jgi:hypothetical protein